MKKLLVFIALLLSSSVALACSYYPDSGEMRFSIFAMPGSLYKAYAPFNYTGSYFSYDEDSDAINFAVRANVELWQEYCNHKVDTTSIREAVYDLDERSIKNNPKNSMILYLLKAHDTEAINYLLFAKGVGIYNAFHDDPWERGGDWAVNKRNSRIQQGLKSAAACKNEDIRVRYYFQLMRLGFYNQDSGLVQSVYDKYLSKRQLSSVVDYWCLYFLAAVQKDPVQKSFYAAQAFYNAVDKRKNAVQMFDHTIDINSVLGLAVNNKQRAAILATYAVRRRDFSLGQIRQLYKADAGSDAVGFLLVREINKLEDWIFTPYYCCFGPEFRDEAEYNGTVIKEQRIAQDRAYAAKLLAFVNTVNLKTVENPEVFIAAKAYLLFMVQDYAQCTSYCVQALTKLKNKPAFTEQVKMVQAMCLTANQQTGNAVLPESIKAFVVEQYNNKNNRFIFAIARQLEFLGNTATAGMLYAKFDNVIYGAEKKLAQGWWQYYEDYFSYLNHVYTAAQTQNLIAAFKKGGNDPFTKWLTSGAEYERLYELLGTKYIRENKLYPALAAFNKMEDKYRGANLYNNPFYEFNYTPDFVPRRDSITLTKAGITKYLINCINKSADVKGKDRAYYAFLAGNCYYNMSQYGNSWIMRRYGWTSEPSNSILTDNAEYFSNNLAQHYYMLAYRLAKTRKLRALCLRMAAHCKHDELLFKYTGGDFYNMYGNTDYYYKAMRENVYTQKFKKLYPDYADHLFGGCYRYNEYFKI